MPLGNFLLFNIDVYQYACMLVRTCVYYWPVTRLSETNRVQRIHIYKHARVRDVSFLPNRDIAYVVLVYVVIVKCTWNHIHLHIYRENICTNICLETSLGNKFKITLLTLHDRYVKMKTVCGTPEWKDDFKIRIPTKRDGDFLIKIAVASKYKGVREVGRWASAPVDWNPSYECRA